MKELLSAPLSPRKLVEYLFLFLLLASVLSAAAYGGYWYGKQGSKSPLPPQPVPSGQTSNWKVYKNKEYLFELKYPESWKARVTVNEEYVNEGITDKTVKIFDPKEPDNMFSIYVTNFAANKPLEGLYTTLSKFMVGDSPALLEDTKVGGVRAKKVLLYSGEVDDDIFGKISVNYILNHNDLRWQLSFPSRDEKGSHQAVFDQILSTFRFLTAESSSGGPLAIPPEFPIGDFYTCNSRGDCVSVDAGYCGCSEGGKATAINKDQVKEWEKQWQVEGNPLVFCSQVMSTDPTCSMVPRCIEKRCQLLEKGAFCGGFAGKSCPTGYHCVYDGHYPDAGGTCQKN